MKRKLNIAVRELVEFVCRSGDLEFAFSGTRRSVDAIYAHQKIQNSRPSAYQPEVTISHQHETDDFILTISGRMDGLFSETDDNGSRRIIVDEIKTTDRDIDDIVAQRNPLHWGQVKCYAFMIASEQQLQEIDAQLTYFQIDTGDLREDRQSFSIEELTEFYLKLINSYLDWATTLIDWYNVRDTTIASLDFPFDDYRPGQRPMAVEVYRTIRSGGHLLVQAATGIGKTMAVIFPAVKAMAASHTTKIFYLTVRTTARTVAEKALAELRQCGLRLKSLTLTAKDKICFNPDKECSGDACEYARGYYDRLHNALPDIFMNDAMGRRTIESAAHTHRLCPFELSLTLSVYVDCVICDYNYAFDPRVYLRRFFLDASGDYTFLIDEAHNLVDRSREMFSAEIFKSPILKLRREVRDSLPGLYKSLGRLNSQMARILRESKDQPDERAEKDPPEILYPHLRNFTKIAEDWLSRNQKTAYREELLSLYFAVISFIRVYQVYDESYVCCYERQARELKIKLFCIDPSSQLAEALNRCQAAVFFSATMTPASYFKKMFGCSDSAIYRQFPSPFSSGNLGLFICNRISTYFKQRQHTTPDVIQAASGLVHRKKGNYLLYFPSYEYMQMIYDGFTRTCPNIKTVCQTSPMSESDRSAFLEQFSHDNPDTLVGFAVLGGIFGEGIDLVGDRLSGAMIVGVGLPGLSLERELIRTFYEDDLGAGFEFAYMYPGINRVLQAAGRVIRSENDRGVVLLVDLRYGTARYHALFPPEWHPVSLSVGKELESRLEMFWKKSVDKR